MRIGGMCAAAVIGSSFVACGDSGASDSGKSDSSESSANDSSDSPTNSANLKGVLGESYTPKQWRENPKTRTRALANRK